MRTLFLCCLVALALCQESFSYELRLNPDKIYEYQYEGQVKFGMNKPNRAESGARIKYLVKIMGQSADIYLLKFSNVVFEELNGIKGKSDFVAATQLATKITQQLSKPITFRYTAGKVSEIRAPAEVTDTVVNIVRGFLSFFQVTVKSNQDIYELEEEGIHGRCLSNYVINKDNNDKVTGLTQVVDVTNCREKAAFHTGLANFVEDKISKQKGEFLASTVKYTYDFEGSEEKVIVKAQALELQYFTPFNVKGGSFKMEAKKELVLASEKEKTQKVQLEGQMEPRGSLKYKIVKDNANIPVVMQKLDNPVPKAEELIQQLAHANAHQIDSTTTEQTMKLYQLLRMIPREKLIEMWGKLKSKPDERHWFLHTVVEVNDERILYFLEQYLHETDINPIEAITAIIQAFNHLQATPEQLRLAAEKFLNMEYSNHLIRQTVVLSYGSLVFKHCAYHTPCPEAAIQPLKDMAEKVRSSNDEMEKILVLKALGNTGHPRSLKIISKFLPGVDPNPDQIDKRPRVVSAAVQAMRLIYIRDPHGVQLMTLKLFLNRNLEAELRMLAFMIMFDTKPSMALVSTVTGHLLEEKDMQLVNFAYTYLRSLARSTTPNNHHVSTAASVAVKILSPKIVRQNSAQSRATRIDWFNEDYLTGMAAEAFLLKRAAQMIPAEMMVKVNFYFIGRILQLVEFGIRPEGLKELFGANIPELNGDMSMTDFQAIFDVLRKWETLPDDKPLFSFHTRAFGQEFFFADITKDYLQRITRAFSESGGKDNFLWRFLEKLMQGFSWRGVLPFMTAEARYMEATTVGLPMEASKYYHVVNGLAVEAHAAMNPQVTENLRQLQNSEISLKTNGFIGYTKNMWLFYGINTDLFQSAIEVKTISPLAIPFNFNMKINIPARKFELEIPRSNKELEIFSFSSNAYAISRNIIHPESPKRTPLIANDQSDNQQYSQVMQQYQPNRMNIAHSSCSESSTYGLNFCTEMQLKREYYQEEYPLYYFLGFTHFAFKVAPVQQISVEKIRLEINFSSSSSSTNARQLINALRKLVQEIRSSRNSNSQELQDRPSRGTGESLEHVVQVKLVALSGSSEKGYDTSLYYRPSGDAYSSEMIASYIGESSNWKMCVGETVTSGVEAHIGWGSECKEHIVVMRAARVTGSKPGFKAVFHYDKMPESMENYGRRIARYIPGMAFLMGVNQVEESNAKQEVSATVTAASADSIDVKIKFPEFTLYREALSSPVTPAYFLNSDRTINSNMQS